MRVNRKALLRGTGRAAAVLAVAGAAAAAVFGATQLALPTLAVEPPSALVQPAESSQLRVCPGPLLELAGDASDATAASSFGTAAVAIAADPADAVVEQAPIEAPDNAGAGADGGPLAISAEPGSVEGGMLAGAQAQQAAAESVSGLAAAACAEPAAESWLVAGATDVGRSGLVLLANPGLVASNVDVRVFGETGPIDAPGALGIVVPPGTQRVVSLAGLAPNVRSTVVHVTSTGAPVAAALQHSVVLGLDAAGVELSTPTALPADRQVIPGFTVADGRGVDPQEDHAEGDDHPAVRLYAPGGGEVAAVVRVLGEDGSETGRVDVTLVDGQVSDVPLGALTAGRHTLVVEADAPVVAAARATVLGTGDEATQADLAWHPATGPLLERAAVAVPQAPGPVLHLANPGEEATTATVVAGTDERELTLEGGAAASVDLQPGERVVLEDVQGLHAGLTFGEPQAIAAMPVAPPGPLDAPVRVYPG
ncbi:MULTISPECIES: DUF5719 family protein [unclassified Agromyces]|uniref:DUF5719 family protein n=1 Tax=unclassified Agromyces TaxID=2639701 RepID=UPI003014ACA3